MMLKRKNFHRLTGADWHHGAQQEIMPRRIVVAMRFCALAAVLALSMGRASGQTTGQSASGSSDVASRQRPSNAPADAVIFVNPRAYDSASVGIAYNRRIAHSQVRTDVDRLLKISGWQAARDLQISDASVHPDRPDKFPVTTAAMVTLLGAPQVSQGAPQLLPYLQAYQRFGHVEVIFALSPLNPYLGINQFDSKALSVQLYNDEGVYRYEATIHDHTGNLPALVPSPTKAPAPITDTRVEPRARHLSLWSFAFVVAGLGLIASAGIYSVLQRRGPRTFPARNPLRR